jgi:phospholipase C
MRAGTAPLFTIALLAAAFPAAAAPSGGVPSDAQIARKVRYVFVIYQENRSFDHYFGTFPGANGVWGAQARAHGFRQYNPVSGRWTTPFRLTTPDLGLENNARAIVEAGIDGGRMDGFVAAQIGWAKTQGLTGQRLASVGDEIMGHVDCDTIPYYWRYASRFALFDNFFQGVRAPSAPSNIEIIAAQNGETEYARYGPHGPPYTAKPNGTAGRGVPVFVDLDPAWGPYNGLDSSRQKQVDQTYANVLLNLEGAGARKLSKYTQAITRDIAYLSKSGYAPVGWTWYQQGYDNPSDPERLTFVAHHLAPHYFGYIANNPTMNARVADISRFYADAAQGRLGSGGLFYLKGGFGSNLGLKPSNAAPNTFLGDDEHPGEADLQIGEADVASLVNAIARSKYWSRSAILISWDDPGGYWDHVPPPPWLVCPDGHPCGNGQRVGLLLISPFARTAVVHEFDDQSSVVKFAERVFGRPPLASLPDERAYAPFGPRDGSTVTGDLAGGFDAARLGGSAPPLPASRAIIPDEVVRAIPSPSSCRSIGVRPVPPPGGVSDTPPPAFNPRAIVVTLPKRHVPVR